MSHQAEAASAKQILLSARYQIAKAYLIIAVVLSNAFHRLRNRLLLAERSLAGFC
jgi:hypothetical protein